MKPGRGPMARSDLHDPKGTPRREGSGTQAPMDHAGGAPSLAVPGEFTLIARHFRPLAGPAGLDLLDDAAVLTPPEGRQLVLAADAMVAGVHFLPGDPPDLLARKLLRVNLSDLAAMGATPLGYLMTIAAPRDTADAWFAGFAAGLAADQAEFGLALLGGDTTATPGPLCLSLTILGHVAPGMAVRRTGAQAGDGVWVTGTIGDGALGLAVATGALVDGSGFLLERYRLPRPRLLPIGGLAAAAIDVSDGLVQDLGHLCRAGGVGAEILAESVPASDAALAVREAVEGAIAHGDAAGAWLRTRLTGGDDYELLLAVPEARTAALAAMAQAACVRISRIGRFVAGAPQVRVGTADGRELALGTGGWSHF